jgi:hypothetical protein
LDLAYFEGLELLSTFVPKIEKIFIPPQVSSESLLPSDYPSKTLFFAVLLQNIILYLKVRFKRTYAATSLLMFKILKHE